MHHVLLRATLLVAVVSLVFGSNISYGRGPGGRGGNAGGRAGAGRGDRGPELSNLDLKKKGDGANLGPNLGANGGLTAAAQNFNGAAQNLQGAQGKLKNAAGGAGQFQGVQQQPGQKWQSRDGQAQQNAQSALNDFKNGPQPFTAAWYADHPNAWQATHPHADAWAAATATSVAAWLGWAAYDANNANDGNGAYYNTTVVYEQAPAEASESEPAATEETIADATVSLQENAGDWLTLGIYSVLSNSGEPTSRLMQLATNRQGDVRGVYYDAISNTSQNLSGRIDQSTQQAQWTIESNPQTTFAAALSRAHPTHRHDSSHATRWPATVARRSPGKRQLTLNLMQSILTSTHRPVCWRW